MTLRLYAQRLLLALEDLGHAALLNAKRPTTYDHKEWVDGYAHGFEDGQEFERAKKVKS